MPLQTPEIFNMKDLTLDVRLEAIVDGKYTDFTGKSIFSVDFFRHSIGFGITGVDIEVNTSLQPIITITFKDLYGNTVFGKTKNNNPDAADSQKNDVDFSALFNWPPPKFLFTFKGFLGKSVTWMLNMKKSSVSYDSSDGSYDIKCEFVPNQWGFLSDLPFLYLLAVKSLKKKSGTLSDDELKKVQTIFDLIKIGKQVEVKTKETTKEFDNILKQMTLLKSSRFYDALIVSKVVNFNEAITGQVGSQTISPFTEIKVNKPIGAGNEDIDTPEKIKSLAVNSQSLNRLNLFLLFTSQIGAMNPIKDLTYKKIATGELKDIANVIPDFEKEKNARLRILEQNIENIENAIKAKTYDSSKNQLEKIVIGEIFEQLAGDAGYIMGRILEAGYRGYHKNNTQRNLHKGRLIGKSFPLWLTSKKQEEKPATIENTEGIDFGIESYELQFVTDFIDAISEGIATELADDNANAQSPGDSLIKKRINNLEALRGNPYQPFYQSIAENILVRGGIIGYLTRSPDPNKPGDYDNIFSFNNATNAEEILPLADADLENITDEIISALDEEDFRLLKRFCVFWDNMLTEDVENLKKPKSDGTLEEGPSLTSYLSLLGEALPATLLDYKVLITKSAQWNGVFPEKAGDGGIDFDTLRNIVKTIFRPREGGSSNSIDSTNSNFVDINSLQAVKLVNNGIAYFKPPTSLGGFGDSNVYVIFDGPDSTKTQEIMSADSDAELKNDIEKQKKEENPLGFVNVQNPIGDDGELIGVIVGANKRIPKGLMLNYSRLLNPSAAFFKNPFSITIDDNIEDYFVVEKDFTLGNPSLLADNQIPAKNITISIASQPGNESKLIFGPFIKNSSDSVVHRGYIKRMCSKLKEKLDTIEQKRNQVISDVLGKAGEQKDALYKQMHVLYQQWEVLIIKDSDSAKKQNTTGDSPGAISSEMGNRYTHINLNTVAKIESDAADNTFIYGYPLNFIQGKEKIDVKKSIINIEALYKPNGNTTILNIIQQICTTNNFVFIPMPGDAGAFDVSEIFTTHAFSEPTVRNFFYVQFAPTPESRSTLRNDDSVVIATSENIKSKLPDALEIKFGSPDNQIVKNISVDTSESKATAESIVNLQRLVDNENQNKKVTTDCSMLPVMEGRSYKATIDMIGNAQVFPMQFFYLDSIPLFNGLYQIMKVKHSIKPNDMSTSAEGIRMRMDFQTGDFGGIPPVTLDSLANLPVKLIPLEPPTHGPNDFANAVPDQGVGEADNKTGTRAAGSTASVVKTSIVKGGSDIVPNSSVGTSGIILPPDLRAVQGSIRLTQSSDGNKAIPISDFTSASGKVFKKEDIIRDMNIFIQDVLGPFATFLKQNYPHLYKNWIFSSGTRSFVPEDGAKISQHQKGQAVDSQIIGKPRGVETMRMNLELLNAMLTWYQQNPVKYDQLLWETRAKTTSSWIHLSYVRGNGRNMFLRYTDDKTNHSCKLNIEGKKIQPGVTESQIILSF